MDKLIEENKKKEKQVEYSHCEAVFKTKAHLTGKSNVAFSPDGKKVVTAGVDGILKVWDVRRMLARDSFE